jgi:hypothetical protein
MRTTVNAQAVNLHLKVSCGFREQRNYVVSSEPKSTEFPSPNFFKQRPLWCLTGPTDFQQKRNFVLTIQNGLHVVHIKNPMNLTNWLA